MKNAGIIVLGMHRSGTSCLAGMLECAGFHTANIEEWSPDNTKGSRENTSVVRLNDSLLKDGGGSWKQPDIAMSPTEEQLKARNEVIQSLDSVDKSWMFKDPRSLLTLSFWLEAIPDARLVGIFRHPIAVANSLAVRNSMPIEEGLRLWMAYNRILLDLAETKNIPLLFFSKDLENFITAAREIVEAHFSESISEGILRPDCMDEFVVDDLVHQVQHQDTDLDTIVRQTTLSEDESKKLGLMWKSLLDHAWNPPTGEAYVEGHTSFSEFKINDLIDEERFEDALNAVKSILSSNPKRTDLWQKGLEIVKRTSSAENLIEWVKNGLVNIPDNPSFLFEHAKLTWQSGDEAGAIRVLERVSKLAPGWPPALSLLSQWYYSSENWKKAANTMTEISSPSHLKSESLYFAQIFIDTGKGYSEEESIRVPLLSNSNNQEIAFELSGYDNIKSIRFDPLNDYAVVEVNDIHILDEGRKQQNLDLASSTAQLVSNNTFFFSDKDPQIQLKIPHHEAQPLTKLVVNLRYLKTGTPALLQCYENIKRQFDTARNQAAKQNPDDNEESFIVPTAETEQFMAGWNLEKIEVSEGEVNTVLLTGWVVPKKGRKLNIVFRYDGLTRSYNFNVDRPDVLKRLAIDESASLKYLKHGFQYSVPKASFIEIGIECDMKLYWIETVQT